MKHILLFLSIIFICINLNAEKMEVTQIHNPKLDGQNVFVSDINGILSLDEVHKLNKNCSILEQTLGVEIAIVIVPGIEGDDEYDFAYNLFNTWKIGKEGKDNGLLWLYVVDIRAMKFETGLGLEGLLPDAYLNRVLEETIFPLMREGKTDEAFDKGLQEIFNTITTDDAKEELLLNTNTTESFVIDIIVGYLSIALLVLVILSVVFYKKTKSMRGENNVLYFRVKPIVGVSLLLSILFPIPIIFFWKYCNRFMKELRKKPMRCSECGGTMRLLSEEEEDKYLNKEQQAEETVKSVDYDVWKCNVCDNTKILAYKNVSTKYTRCPKCGAKTYTLVSDDIIEPATSLSAGKGQKVHECANCKFRKVATYVIPMIIVSSGTRNGGSNGGFSGGGSFGGGMSGGGGAGGRF